MSSFRATLEMGGKEYDVLYSNYEFKRNTDAKGKPASSVTGGYVSVTVESTEDTTAIEAMLNNQFKTVDGKIVYKKTDEDAKMKEIEFKNAYIVHYKETLDTTNDVPMTIAMTLSAETLTIGNAELDNRWAKVLGRLLRAFRRPGPSRWRKARPPFGFPRRHGVRPVLSPIPQSSIPLTCVPGVALRRILRLIPITE